MIIIEPTAEKVFTELVLPSKSIGVRIKVQSAGCNGHTYVMEWCYTKQEGDHIFQGVKDIYIDSKSMLYLYGSHLVYKQDKFQEGFEFINPNETSKCGCGESFYVA
tara:strand:- start:153 stop:470 length:318 start_codon:yes stop_codon:yes gene_type:complete